MQLLGPEGSTWLKVGPAITANGFTGLALVPGMYRVAITTATAVYATLTRPAPMLLKNAAASFISSLWIMLTRTPSRLMFRGDKLHTSITLVAAGVSGFLDPDLVRWASLGRFFGAPEEVLGAFFSKDSRHFQCYRSYRLGICFLIETHGKNFADESLSLA